MVINQQVEWQSDTARFVLRHLLPSDVSSDYIKALETRPHFIRGLTPIVSVATQRKYVTKILEASDDALYGLFRQGKLIGTAGVQESYSKTFIQKVNLNVKTIATLGVYIFSNQDRGKDLGKALIWGSCKLYCHNKNYITFGAEIDDNNFPSIFAFRVCGFQTVDSDDDGNTRVIALQSSVIQPEWINEPKVKK